MCITHLTTADANNTRKKSSLAAQLPPQPIKNTNANHKQEILER
jgi:hypothetical protein